MSVPVFHIDAFTSRPFAGNPAAVCFLDGPRDPSWMQSVAREMSLSETAFVRAEGSGYAISWYTPTTEVQLCGHATLAAAHALWEQDRVPAAEPIRFQSRSGPLIAARGDEWIELDFPARPARSIEPPPGLLAALGVRARFVGRNLEDYLVEVGSEAEVRALTPDLRRLRQLGERGVIVTAPAADADVDFVSRFFAPGVGIDEDPVTGSAHCCLGPFWGERLERDALVGYQASERGGRVRVRLAGDRVILGGQAVTVMRGELRV